VFYLLNVGCVVGLVWTQAYVNKTMRSSHTCGIFADG
jgi:hypothetical protein